MTGREIKLWIAVGLVVAGALLFNMLSPYFMQTADQSATSVNEEEAFRILRAEDNIVARNQAALARYQQLCEGFYRIKDRTAAELDILEVVEEIAANNGLRITLKNTVQLAPTELGVALEGTTGSEMFFRFLQQLTEAPVGFKVKRLQLHSVPEKRELDYQVVISVLMVK
ncbi:MAG TPA: hypothetical protein VEC37_00480 [Bacillota bacterium]|nr:hypothetical protein [Bacillota bacterium]